MFNSHNWKGDEIIINNDIEKNIKVSIYHGDQLIGVVDNDTTLTNVRAQIRQKFWDETGDGKHDMDKWVDYHAEWDGWNMPISPYGGMDILPYSEVESCLDIICYSQH